MIGDQYYFGLIRKYVIIVGSIFDNISIIRYDEAGNESAVIRVPIMYSAKDKMLARVIQDPDINRPTAITTMPMISFELKNLRYLPENKLNTINKVGVKKDANNFHRQYVPVPYSFDFEVNIYVKFAEDGTKIIEQILPFFTPDYTVSAKLIPEMEEYKDIPVVLAGITHEDTYSGDFKERRAIIWTLRLNLTGNLYGPIKDKPIIKFQKTNFYAGDPSPTNQYDFGKLIQPGLDINNMPTSNSAASIPNNVIEATDDYGFIESTYFNKSGNV